MPRTFTLHAIQFLGDLWHFRHVNDMDAIPRAPPEAALDNYLYDAYGPVGLLAGFSWSLRQAVSSAVFKHEDPFSHHGEIAMFSGPSNTSNRRSHHTPLTANPMARPIAALSPTNYRKSQAVFGPQSERGR